VGDEPTDERRVRDPRHGGGRDVRSRGEELTFHEATAFDGDHHHFSDDEIETGESDSHAAEQVAFLDAVAAGEAPDINTIEEALSVQRVIDAIYRSSGAARRSDWTERPHPLSEPIRSCVPFASQPVTRDAGPTPPSERIVSLDALRGVALLGILLINVWSFSMPEQTLLNPTVYGDFTGANYWAWAFSHVFGQNKFITLFSALFGAGILLFIDSKRGERTRRSPASTDGPRSSSRSGSCTPTCCGTATSSSHTG